jgi:hypothetical protein
MRSTPIAGEIIDEEGQLVPDSIVVSGCNGRGTQCDVANAADGRFELSVSSAPEVVYARSARWFGRNVVDNANSKATITILVRRTVRIAGAVLESSDWKPIDAQISCTESRLGLHGDAPPFSVQTRTDRSGRFECDGLAPGRVDVSATRFGVLLAFG